MIQGEIQLPLSKSISNRLLIIHALMNKIPDRELFSPAQDTSILYYALTNAVKKINVGNAGTSMRFLTAFLALKEGEFFLTGDQRMKERPIGELVAALKQLGAAIEFEGQENFPPIKIKDRVLYGRKISIDAGVSSQFISAILLIAPYLKGKLALKLEGESISRPYIEMTIALMRNYGAVVEWEGDTISVEDKPYKQTELQGEADWSAASYFYALAALNEEVDIHLKGLQEESIQGDSIVREIFAALGVDTVFDEEGVRLLKKEMKLPEALNIDCTDCPDLALTFAAVLPAMGLRTTLSGLKSLRIKETDRIAALKTELEKIGQKVKVVDDALEILPGDIPTENIAIDTYEDHRMAMAFAPLARMHKNIRINRQGVVNKSFPGFWKEFEKI